MPYRIDILRADITTLQVDAIVNAANSSLLGGGGVDGAIHRKAGPRLLEECQQIRARQGGCQTGEAVYTGAGALSAKYVIHTVGPVWSGGNNHETQLLTNCYKNTLAIAARLNVATIAFPNISTGIYRFPKPLAAEIAIRTVRQFLNEQQHGLQTISFCCFDDENYDIYVSLQGSH